MDDETMDDMRSAPKIIDDQNVEPVWIVNQTCDGLIPYGLGQLHDVMTVLGLDYDQDEPFPLTKAEQDFIGEDCVKAPYGGAFTGPAWLFKGEKYIGLDVEVCYDGPDRPFENYGGTLYADTATAWNEAQRLAAFLNPKMNEIGGHAIAIEGGPDRHFVAVMFPPKFLIDTFGNVPGNKPFNLFKNYARKLFKGYKPAAVPIDA